MVSPLFPAGTKGDLLLLIKQLGAVSLDDAEGATGLTRPTLRQHLGGLERDRLVERSTRKQRRGRPSLRYTLTPEAQALFPSRDDVLLGRLLDYLMQEGHDALVQRFFEHFWDERLRDVRLRVERAQPGDEDSQLAVLADVLREQGFMPEVKHEAGTILIRECNCPFPEAVKRTRLPCQLEARFFEQLFDDRIRRVTYIPDGFPACSYVFPTQQEVSAS